MESLLRELTFTLKRLIFVLITDKSKPSEREGRKTTGPFEKDSGGAEVIMDIIEKAAKTKDSHTPHHYPSQSFHSYHRGIQSKKESYLNFELGVPGN